MEINDFFQIKATGNLKLKDDLKIAFENIVSFIVKEKFIIFATKLGNLIILDEGLS